ncbi:nuclear speckle RNA-binding protein B-like [Abrus precatorius]|uniref:Nuclear speckle RNA-binding protein B-like n=1 Tax=Abrus precatorius TaxID=3816 RepID=A0A8B8K7C0_ABRPR|nr:nuclear speckle RNA-binding protein B-like [Abrus precatorius]
MNFPDIPTGRSPKRELQGPRPSPLRINKDSHKIKKPPLAPPPSQPQAPPRQPIIIYTVSPKVIHTTPSDFMSLVQRLTGSSSSSSSLSSFDSSNKVTTQLLDGKSSHEGAISPAARYAAMEKARIPQRMKQHPIGNSGDDGGGGIEVEVGLHGVERPNMFHGILSPGPNSLSPIPSNFFSPPSTTDPHNMVTFFHDLSPVLHGSKSFMEGTFILPSPSNFISPHTPSIDLFNNFSG